MIKKRLNTLLSILLALSFSYSYSADYYWINDSGDWNDPSHWSFSSGGSGGAGVPGSSDNVFFDNNSFSVHSRVNINSNLSINDFNFSCSTYNIWFDDPSKSKIWEINGSFLCSASIAFIEIGKIKFVSPTAAVFNPGGNYFQVDLEFNGNYTMDEVLVTKGEGKTLSITGGEFRSNGHSIVANRIEVPANEPTVVDLSTSELLVYEDADFALGSNLELTNHESKLWYDSEITKDNFTGTGGFDIVLPKGTTLCGNGITVITSFQTPYNGEAISCNGECDAIVDIVVVTPSPGCGVSVSINGSSFTSDSLVSVSPSGDSSFFRYTNLCANSYTFQAVDSCQEIVPGSGFYQTCQDNIIVNAPFALTAVVGPTSEPTCPDSCDGTALLIITGGTGDTTILWSNGETTNPANELCGGLNSYTVTDENGCEASNSVNLASPDPFALNITTTPLLCNGICDGTATAAPTGGTVTTSGNFRIHTFTSSGTFTNTVSNLVTQYLVIAGGGSGGSYGAGGGAGGYRSSVPGQSSGGGGSAESTLTLSSGAKTVTVGAGATGTSASGGNTSVTINSVEYKATGGAANGGTPGTGTNGQVNLTGKTGGAGGTFWNTRIAFGAGGVGHGGGGSYGGNGADGLAIFEW